VDLYSLRFTEYDAGGAQARRILGTNERAWAKRTLFLLRREWGALRVSAWPIVANGRASSTRKSALRRVARRKAGCHPTFSATATRSPRASLEPGVVALANRAESSAVRGGGGGEGMLLH